MVNAGARLAVGVGDVEAVLILEKEWDAPIPEDIEEHNRSRITPYATK